MLFDSDLINSTGNHRQLTPIIVHIINFYNGPFNSPFNGPYNGP